MGLNEQIKNIQKLLTEYTNDINKYANKLTISKSWYHNHEKKIFSELLKINDEEVNQNKKITDDCMFGGGVYACTCVRKVLKLLLDAMYQSRFIRFELSNQTPTTFSQKMRQGLGTRKGLGLIPVQSKVCTELEKLYEPDKRPRIGNLCDKSLAYDELSYDHVNLGDFSNLSKPSSMSKQWWEKLKTLISVITAADKK